jgi:hypothetical protein
MRELAHHDVGVAVVSIPHLVASADEYICLIEREDGAVVLAASKSRFRFFSVSPMSLLTTAARSTW